MTVCQSQRHLLEGIDDQDCHKLVCDYGDILSYKVFKFMEAKLKLLFFNVVQVGLVLEAHIASKNH